MSEGMTGLPRYEGHKTVWALKLKDVVIPGDDEPAVPTVFPEDERFAPFNPGEEFFKRCRATKEDPGYFVQYPNGFKSWSPSEAFEQGYLPLSGTMSFGQALTHLKRGQRVARRGWNGKGMFVFLVPGSTFQVNRPPLLGIYPEGTTINYHAHIDMKTADGQVVPWVASQTDVLAEDWGLVLEPAQ